MIVSALVAAIVIIFGLLPLEVDAEIARSTLFAQLARGVIDNPDVNLSLSTPTSCAGVCNKILTCTAFSFKEVASPEDNNTQYECKVAKGAYAWIPDPDANLFAEPIRSSSLDGYTFARDGSYYRITTYYGNGNTLEDSRRFCLNEDANIAVPYPKTVRDAIVTALPTSWDAWIHFGITKTGAAARFVTDDGDVFYSTSPSPDQNWASDEPSGNGDAVINAWHHGWMDDSITYRMWNIVCRKSNHFKRSSINGKYYRMYTQKRTYVGAKTTCTAAGGTLANMISDNDIDATEGYRMQFRPMTDLLFWIGAEDPLDNGNWVWADGSVMPISARSTDAAQIRLWQPLQPSPTSGANERCLAANHLGADNHDCSNLLPFLCEVPNIA